MYKPLAALALLGAVSAQMTTTELWLVGFDQQALVGTVIASDAKATTYSIECSDPDSDDCGVPPSFTFTQGPSTIHYLYQISDDGEGDNETVELGCVITSSESGTCSGMTEGQVAGSSTSSATSTSFSNGGSELGGQVVTITAGAAAAASTAASTAMETSSGSSASSSKSGKSTATSTGGSQTAATRSSSSSTAGVPKITGNAQWVVGGAAAAFALAAL